MTKDEKRIEMCQGILALIKENKIEPAQAYGAQVFIGLAMEPTISDKAFDLVYDMYQGTMLRLA